MPSTDTQRVHIRGVVTHHPYSTARITEWFMELKWDDRTQLLKDALAKAAGIKHPDNKEVYEVTSDGWMPHVMFDEMTVRGTREGKKLYIWFHDADVHFGHSVILGRY